MAPPVPDKVTLKNSAVSGTQRPPVVPSQRGASKAGGEAAGLARAPSTTTNCSTSMDVDKKKIDAPINGALKNTPRPASVKKSASSDVKKPVTSRGSRSSSSKVPATGGSGDSVGASVPVKPIIRAAATARSQRVTVKGGGVQTTIAHNEKPTTNLRPNALRGSRSKGPPSVQRSPSCRDSIDNDTVHVNDGAANSERDEGHHDSHEDNNNSIYIAPFTRGSQSAAQSCRENDMSTTTIGRVSRKCPPALKPSGRGVCGREDRGGLRGRRRAHPAAGAATGATTSAALTERVHQSVRQEHDDEKYYIADESDDDNDDDDNSTTTNRRLTLKGVLEGLIIQKPKQSIVSTVINDTMKIIMDHLKTDSKFPLCKHLNTGSYYEKLKICEPDEFDVMVVLPVVRMSLVEVPGLHGAFYFVIPKRNSELQEFVDGEFVDGEFVDGEFVSPEKIIKRLRGIIKCLLPELGHGARLKRASSGCPAVTIELDPGKSIKPVSVDLVPAIKVEHSPWPPAAKNISSIASNWLGRKRVSKLFKNSVYLVGKKPPRNADGLIEDKAWRISFSELEKELVLNHGSQHTCCEKGMTRCCRKECLKLLKRLLEISKENIPSLNKNVCSYHAKTVWLHACATRPSDAAWTLKDRTSCFINLLEDFHKAASDKVLYHFFLSEYNLFDERLVTRKSLKDLVAALKTAILKMKEGKIGDVFPQ